MLDSSCAASSARRSSTCRNARKVCTKPSAMVLGTKADRRCITPGAEAAGPLLSAAWHPHDSCVRWQATGSPCLRRQAVSAAVLDHTSNQAVTRELLLRKSATPLVTEPGSSASVKQPYGGILHRHNTDRYTAVPAHVLSCLGSVGTHLRLVCCHIAVSQMSALPA